MPPLPALRIGRLRVDRLAILLLGMAVVLTTSAAVATGVLRLLRPGSLPRIVVVGTDLGGLSEEELHRALAALATERERQHVQVLRPPAGRRPRSMTSSPRAALGYRFDLQATVDRVLARGRQTNPFTALADQLRAFVTTTAVAPAERVDGEVLRRWSTKAAARLSVPARQGDIEVEGTSVEAVYPEPGARVDAARLAALARAALLEGRRRVVVAPEDVRPRTDAADVDRAVAVAEHALSAPVTLVRKGVEVTFSPAEIGTALVARVKGGALRLRMRPRRLAATLTQEELAAVENAPVDASFRLTGDTVEIVPATPGFAFSAERTARKVFEVATGEGSRRAELPGRAVTPEFTTREARSLKIRERVSSFTTYHACCEPRVTNIHRIADLVDGVVVEPGETLSLNTHVGPRTRAAGFVAAPSIRDGEFVEEVGGGISQFATTMFNAIYFGGYDFLEYQPHSYYIDRYPIGREATISTPAPDLVFRNDSDAGIYIDTSYTDTSITITFYGNTSVKVLSETGEPYNRKLPPERCRENKNLRRGEERMISEGRGGFDVVVRRILVRGDERTVERFVTRYEPEPRVIERRRCKD